MRLQVFVALVALCAASLPACAEYDGIDLRIPMEVVGPGGLEAVIVRPGGGGRHPLVILSHGSPRDASNRPGMSARGMMPQLVEFARRGFVAVSVLRRGYGSSQGGWAEDFGPCETADYVRAGRAGAADIRAAIAFMARRADVDASRIVAVGVSAGGFATVALTADPPPGLVAAISFAGGRGSRGPDKVCDEDALVTAFRTFGARSRIAMLWVYAENDHFFGPTMARRFLAAFQGAGGHASFVEAEPFGADGHALFSEAGRKTWTPIVDAFLARQGLATTQTELPSRPALQPPAQLSENGRAAFASYLEGAGSKAFAVSKSGGFGWRTGRGTRREATDAAIETCERASETACSLYAVDDAYASPR